MNYFNNRPLIKVFPQWQPYNVIVEARKYSAKLWTNVIIKLLQFKINHFMHTEISLMANIDLTNTREHSLSLWHAGRWVQGPFSPPGPVLIAVSFRELSSIAMPEILGAMSRYAHASISTTPTKLPFQPKSIQNDLSNYIKRETQSCFMAFYCSVPRHSTASAWRIPEIRNRRQSVLTSDRSLLFVIKTYSDNSKTNRPLEPPLQCFRHNDLFIVL